MTQPITPHQAQERARKASPGRKHIVLGQNYERLHAALAIRPKATSDELPELDRAAMDAIERGVA